MIPDDIKLYLPKYLSETSYNQLLNSLKQFTKEPYKNFYTFNLKDQSNFYQGDGLKSLPIYNFQDNSIKNHSAIIISNSCDLCTDNKRLYPTNLLYAPIMDFNIYINNLKQKKIDEDKIKNHILAIKEQKLSSVFYLPKINSEFQESIVFLDRIFNISLKLVPSKLSNEFRYFSLSDYGFYIFLVKLSIHFTRIMENLDRGMS
jgi:hypothetical protein